MPAAQLAPAGCSLAKPPAERRVPKPLLPVLVVLVALVNTDAVAQGRAWLAPRQAVDARVRALLQEMTPAEKFWQLYMAPGSRENPAHDYSNGSFGLQVRLPDESAPTGLTPSEARTRAAATARTHAQRINAIQRYFVDSTRLGIPIIPFEEVLHGVLGPGATQFPQAIALAATFDTGLASRVAQAAAREARHRGIRQALSPVINIATDVRWGRVEETYGEDPFQSTLFGDVFVREFERLGIVATPKHFVANVGEGGRDSYPIDLSRRQLEELHFPPFQSVLSKSGSDSNSSKLESDPDFRAGARSVMTAYNSVDGLPATQNPWLLTDVLRRQWGFTGFVISDAAATGGATVLHHTEPNTPMAAKHAWEAGLDVVFQSTWEQHRPYWQAVQNGLVAPEVIDTAVARVLRAKFEIGLFEDPYVNPDSAAFWNGHTSHLALAREAAAASVVLLRNESRTLPLSPAIGSILVVGDDATEARLGGYSGPGIQPVSILDGIRARVGPHTRVTHHRGPGRTAWAPVVVPDEYLRHGGDSVGLRGEYFDNNRLAGPPRLTRIDRQVDFRWTLNSPGRGIPYDFYSARWTGTLVVPGRPCTPPPGGAFGCPVRRIGVEGNDGYRLWIDDRLVIDNWVKRSYGTTFAPVGLTPGSHAIRLEYFESTGNARLRLVWDEGVDTSALVRMNVAGQARDHDAVVIVAGVEEGEFRDRARLGLPGRQAELIEAVAATGKPVVVVLVGGSAITMPWLDRVGAVVMAWYPGEQGGHGVADVLFGAVNPSGRLPVTFPVEEGQLPLVYNHKPTGRGDDYVDLTGHPLFPFGYGLSYTTFEYDSLVITPDTAATNATVRVSAVVRNTGSRPGHEVVQLYIRDVLAEVARPMQELKGFERVMLQPGESRRVTFALPPSAFEMIDARGQRRVEPGTIRITIGSSSRDIRLRGMLELRN